MWWSADRLSRGSPSQPRETEARCCRSSLGILLGGCCCRRARYAGGLCAQRHGHWCLLVPGQACACVCVHACVCVCVCMLKCMHVNLSVLVPNTCVCMQEPMCVCVCGCLKFVCTHVCSGACMCLSACVFLCVLAPCPCVSACVCASGLPHLRGTGLGCCCPVRLGLVARPLLSGAQVAAALWVSRPCGTRVAVTFLSGHPRVIAGPVASLEEAGLRVGPVKVLIKFQVSLVPGQRGSKNRVWRGSGLGRLSGFPASEEPLLPSPGRGLRDHPASSLHPEPPEPLSVGQTKQVPLGHPVSHL